MSSLMGIHQQHWVKVIIGINTLLVLVLFRLPSTYMPNAAVRPLDVWLLGSTLLVVVLFISTVFRRLTGRPVPKPTLLALVLDGTLIGIWCAAVTYFCLKALLTGLSGL